MRWSRWSGQVKGWCWNGYIERRSFVSMQTLYFETFAFYLILLRLFHFLFYSTMQSFFLSNLYFLHNIILCLLTQTFNSLLQTFYSRVNLLIFTNFLFCFYSYKLFTLILLLFTHIRFP